MATVELPGGAVVVGTVDRPGIGVVMDIDDQLIDLPAVDHNGGSVFAVPLDERLTVSDLRLVEADGTLIASQLHRYPQEGALD